jgi:SET domain-containing protein
VARRRIAAGEEITFDYGYTLDDYREHPCQCGAAACAGFMVAEALRDYVKKK